MSALASILAAAQGAENAVETDKSEVPFDFPSSAGAARGVMTLSMLLVLLATSMAIYVAL